MLANETLGSEISEKTTTFERTLFPLFGVAKMLRSFELCKVFLFFFENLLKKMINI